MKNRGRKCVLVTGSAGFIGGNFVKTFKHRFPQIHVIGLDVKKGSSGEDVFYRGSITDSKLLDQIFRKHKPEYVFHFAAIARVPYSVLRLAETTHANVYGTALLLEKSRDARVKRFIFSSSSSIYGGAKKLPTKEHENPPNPRSPYAAQKLMGEMFCKQASTLYNLDTVCLRYFNVYGPGQFGDAPYSTVISAWLETLFFRKNKKPFLEGDGKQSRDFCYVDDVVNANILAMRYRKTFNGEVFNVGEQDRTDLLTVKKLIEQQIGRSFSLEQRGPRVGDVRHTCADITKAKKWFGYSPCTPLKKGLQLTINWFRERE